MKEPTKKIISNMTDCVILVFFVVLALYNFPSWLLYTFFGFILVFLVLLLILKNKTKKKEKYYYYTFISSCSSGYGTQCSKTGEFDFVRHYKNYKDANIVMIKEISKAQYDGLYDLEKKRSEKKAMNK